MSTLVAISDWRMYLQDGISFLATANNAARKRRDIFTPEILYNIVGMGIEKLFQAYLMFHGDLADHHTMIAIIRSVERHTGPLPEMEKELRYLDSFQELCDLDQYNHRAPEWDDVPRILAIGGTVKTFVTAVIGTATRA